MVAQELIDVMGESSEIPDELFRFAEFANKAKGEIDRKRRWRAANEPIRKVINLSELIKKREQKAELK